IASLDDTSFAIDWLCKVEYKAEQKRFKARWGKHPLLKNEDLKTEIANSVMLASNKYQVDPFYILVTLWYESKLDPKVSSGKIKGNLGERGLGQQHGLAARGCNFDSVFGQVDCTAKYLKYSINKCGSIERSINFYRSGSTCKEIRGTKTRINLLHRLRKAVDYVVSSPTTE
ncbi:MAG: hypothetical protein ACW98X_24030, partial [Promethearchaeota archaeon]